VANTARTEPGRRESLLWSQVVTDPQRQRPPPATRDTSNHTHPQSRSAPTGWSGVRWSRLAEPSMQSSSDRPVSEDGEIIHHHQPMGGFGVGLHTIELTVRAQAIKLTPCTLSRTSCPFLVTRPARRDHRRDRKRLGRNRHRMPASYSASVLLSYPGLIEDPICSVRAPWPSLTSSGNHRGTCSNSRTRIAPVLAGPP
jgi:hypothetical protein